MKYTIIYNTIPETLIDKVNQLISAGWKPIGGIAISCKDAEETFYQALINNGE